MRIFVSYNQDDCKPSYGHGEPRLLEFIHHLDQELKSISGERVPLLFRDQTHIPLGARWSKTLGQVLQDCTLMISMCSPSYVRSKSCHKEFRAIENRLRLASNNRPPGEPVPTGILPILWVVPDGRPENRFPTELRQRQLKNDSLPESYVRHGLKHLYELSNFSDDRIKAVKAIAAEIRAALGVRFDPAPNAFDWHQDHGTWRQDGGRDEKCSDQPNHGQIRVKVTFVAGSRNELSGIREYLGAYGQSCEDWCPFPQESLEIDIQDSAGERRLVTSALPLDASFRDYVDRSLSRREIILVLVDPWTVRIQKYQSLCAEKVDTAVFPNGGMIAIENEGDPETRRETANLHSALAAAFPRKSRDAFPSVSLYGVRDRTLFRRTLDKHLEAAKNYLVNVAPVAHPALDGGLRDRAVIPVDVRPEVQGPGWAES